MIYEHSSFYTIYISDLESALPFYFHAFTLVFYCKVAPFSVTHAIITSGLPAVYDTAFYIPPHTKYIFIWLSLIKTYKSLNSAMFSISTQVCMHSALTPTEHQWSPQSPNNLYWAPMTFIEPPMTLTEPQWLLMSLNEPPLGPNNPAAINVLNLTPQ